MFYALGGVARVDYGTTYPYNFAENGLGGGGGLRLMFSDRWGLRLDGRAFFDPKKSLLTGSTSTHLIASAGLSYMGGLPRTGTYVARGGGRDYPWDLGAQGGAIPVQKNAPTSTGEPHVGAHTAITQDPASL